MLLLLACTAGTVTGDDSDDSVGDSDNVAVEYDVCADGTAEFATLQAAVDAASEGAVIDLCPGRYQWVEIERIGVEIHGHGEATIEGGTHPAVLVDSQSVTLDGVGLEGHGAQGTYYLGLHCVSGAVTLKNVEIGPLTGESGFNAVFTESCNVVVDGLRMEGSTGGLSFYQGSLDMKHSVLIGNGPDDSVLRVRVDGALVRNVAVVGNQFDNDLVVFAGTVKGSNLLFWDNEEVGNGGWAYSAEGLPSDLQNSVIGNTLSGWTATGIEASTFQYNAVWNNGDRPQTFDGEGIIEADPRFVDAKGRDFRLEEGFSPLIDAGNPLTGYNDTDGTRSDIGLFGGPDGDWAPSF